MSLRLPPLLSLTLVLSLAVVVGCTETKPHDDHANHKATIHAPGGTSSPAVKAAYPLTTCVVSDEKIGDHGKPFDYMHEGRLVRLCCEACVDQFKEDPDKYLAKIDAAKKKAE